MIFISDSEVVEDGVILVLLKHDIRLYLNHYGVTHFGVCSAFDYLCRRLTFLCVTASHYTIVSPVKIIQHKSITSEGTC